jgi:hypothetical protein
LQTTIPFHSGPPYDNVPVFQWSTSPYSNLPHNGMPDIMKFPWVNYTL